ncbi:hypothetical protein V8E55_009249 [Tylopilus felleus]
MKSHAEKFKDDTVSCQAYRDRNMVTKCVNSLMGRQEVSHQQAMSFLIGGGDVYASHDFRPFQFYECLKALDLYERERNNRVSENEGDDEGEDEEWRDEITIDVSSGSPAVVSDMADHQYRPVEATFEKMSLWEFIENTRKVPKTHTLHDDNVEQDGENSRSSNDEDGNRSQGRPRTPRYAFSSEEHPQFCSHDIKLRSSPTIPVIIGHGLPKRDNTAHNDEQFCRYLLLLLKPWRLFNDLSH